MSWLFDASICVGGASAQTTWTVGPAILLPLALAALVYGVGVRRLWRRANRSHPALLRQVVLFAGGWTVLGLALVSPLHALSERLFSAHMIEHELIMAAAAPLLAAAAPGAAMLWALPLTGRRAVAGFIRAGAGSSAWRLVSRRAAATVIHGVAIWVWHVPGLFEAALERGVLHYLQHLSFFGSALLFWWVLLPRRGKERELGASVMHLALTSMHTALLGVLLLLSPRLWYPPNLGISELWGLTPLEDQQLAGLVMWVPAGLVYGGAAVAVAGIWITASSRPGYKRVHA